MVRKCASPLALIVGDLKIWNPVLGLGRIIFVLLTFGYILYKIDYYHDLEGGV